MKNLYQSSAKFQEQPTISEVKPSTGKIKDKVTFVFDAGMGNWSIFFEPLASRLRNKYKLFLLNRPGYDGSAAIPEELDALSMARHMKKVLDTIGIKDSVILVGHSMGGLNILMFQNLFPEMVKGVILIDAANPNIFEELPEVKQNIQEQVKQMKKIRRVAKLGLLYFAKSRIPTFGLPSIYLKDYYKVVTKSYYYQTYIRELENLSQSIKLCKNLPHMGNIPLLDIASRQGLNYSITNKSEFPDFQWLKLQKELVTLSTKAIYLESEKDHFLHLSDIDFITSAIHNFHDVHFN